MVEQPNDVESKFVLDNNTTMFDSKESNCPDFLTYLNNKII